MSKTIYRIVLVLVIFFAGTLLLFHQQSLNPDSIARHQAQQQRLAPAGAIGSGGIQSSATDGEVTYGAEVVPAQVNVREVPAGAAPTDDLHQRYLNGEVDLGHNESPFSQSIIQQLIKQSLAQTKDPNIQIYNPATINGSLQPAASFKTIDYTQSLQGVPPDPELMVGHDHIVVSVNTSFAVYDKQGNQLIAPTLFDSFWGNDCGSGNPSMFLFDPHSTYDESAGRYIMGIMGYDPAINGGDNGWLCYAVSENDSAIGNWYLYNFDCNPGAGTDYFCDYAHIGTGQQALYASANMFQNAAAFIRNHVFAFNKFEMYDGLPTTPVKINQINAYFTIQPTDLKGYTTGGWPTNPNEPHYFIEANFDTISQLTILGWTGGLTSPALNVIGVISVNSYSFPVNQQQPPPGQSITSNDVRLLDAEYWAGRVWASHTIGCNPGSGTVNCIRWYEVNMGSGSPALVQQGTFSSNGQYRSFPDLAVNLCGDMLVGYTKMSTSEFPSVYVAGREVGDSLGQLKDETVLHAGEDYYTAYDPVPRRWGDYTGMTIDPDGVTFWYLGEYARNQAIARWSTWVGSFTWSGCNVSITPTPSPTASVTPTPSITPTATPINAATATSTVEPTATATLEPTATSTPSPTATFTPEPTATATPIVTEITVFMPALIKP